jgi:hypothetical protein
MALADLRNSENAQFLNRLSLLSEPENGAKEVS